MCISSKPPIAEAKLSKESRGGRVGCGGWWKSDSTNRRITYEVEKFAKSYPHPYTLICALFGRRTRRTRYNL